MNPPKERPVIEANGKKKEPQKKAALLADAVRILRASKWDCLAYNERTTELRQAEAD